MTTVRSGGAPGTSNWEETLDAEPEHAFGLGRPWEPPGGAGE